MNLRKNKWHLWLKFFSCKFCCKCETVFFFLLLEDPEILEINNSLKFWRVFIINYKHLEGNTAIFKSSRQQLTFDSLDIYNQQRRFDYEDWSAVNLTYGWNADNYSVFWLKNDIWCFFIKLKVRLKFSNFSFYWSHASQKFQKYHNCFHYLWELWDSWKPLSTHIKLSG